MSDCPKGPSLGEIRGLADEEIVERHDDLTAYFDTEVMMRAAYVAERDRRAQAASERASLRFAEASNRLATLTAAVSTLALIVAVIALVKT